MRPASTILAILIFAFAPQIASAQSVGYTSIPSSAFHGERSVQNVTGTARTIFSLLYAPVYLPQGATVTTLSCGGTAFFQKQIVFTLRRNNPQQANVDMATTRTTLDGTGFEFVSTDAITSGLIDNSQFNYFLVADVDKPEGNQPGSRAACPNEECSVGFCRIRHTLGHRVGDNLISPTGDDELELAPTP